MNYAALNLLLGKRSVNSLSKACKTVYTKHINVFNTAIFKIIHYGYDKLDSSFLGFVYLPSISIVLM